MNHIRRTRLILRQLDCKMATKISNSAAPWRSDFLSHADEMDSPTFVLSTIHRLETSSTVSEVIPRSRTVVFRGFWASLPVNPKNTAELNPNCYESDLPTITTDARMEKVSEIIPGGSNVESRSGGGGPVEATFWAAKARTQWRLRGKAYFLGPDIDSDATAPVREAIEPYMRITGSTTSWEWSRELTAHFGNLSPIMRGSFRNPTPGTPLSEKPEPGLELGQIVDDLHDEVARKNFRVVVIVPEEVDRVDLSDPKRARRWNYKMNDEGSWEVVELWP